MRKRMAVLTLLAIAALPAQAKEQQAAPLFEIAEVDRDTVPAGTPAAFEAIFGRSPKNEALRKVGDSAFLFVPLTLIPLVDGRTALVSTGSSECTGHVCSGVNAVHYLQSDGGGYAVEGEWMDVGATGTFGNPARRWGWSDAVTADPILYTEGGGVWQGYACSHASLIALTSDGPVEIADIPIYYSSEGALDARGIVLEGTITAAEKGRSFTVSYNGSRNFSERYVRGADGRYAVRGGTKVPGC